ncbi:MAG: patatin-like phospholipase family protein [Alphaproteobacteria bacterium]
MQTLDHPPMEVRTGPADSAEPSAHAKPRRERRPEQAVKTVNLALQGGGAHGAFSWGVLDRLLEDGRIGFEGISATSAGAMNAAVLAYGIAEGGREGARTALASFWRRISHAATFSPLQPSLVDRLLHNHALDNSPAFMAFDMMCRMLSPYQLNPGNYNPLRNVLEQLVDFERLRRASPVKLFLSATNVRTGKVRVFRNDDVTADAVLASACLPFMFQAVEIDGEAYWDGGYMGNPAIYPLIYHCESVDVVVVHINPIERPGVPRMAHEIMNRINEISFNSSLMREMRAIAFVSKLIDDGKINDGSLKRVLIHAIAADEVMQKLSVMSKLNADWEFLTHLRDDGREHAERWLEQTFDQLGERSSIDICDAYL